MMVESMKVVRGKQQLEQEQGENCSTLKVDRRNRRVVEEREKGEQK